MRPDDWPGLLDGYVQQARILPFAWGTHDCVTFTTSWHRLMTGRDVFEPFRGKYASEDEAFEVMHTRGVRTMDEAGDYLFGASRERLEFTQRGDIVLAQGALGLCLGARVAMLTVEGMGFLYFSKVEMSWPV